MGRHSPMKAPSSSTPPTLDGMYEVSEVERITIAFHCAREMATLMRFRLRRKPIPRGTSPWDEAVIETIAIGASWPWNLSTVPTRTP